MSWSLSRYPGPEGHLRDRHHQTSLQKGRGRWGWRTEPGSLPDIWEYRKC